MFPSLTQCTFVVACVFSMSSAHNIEDHHRSERKLQDGNLVGEPVLSRDGKHDDHDHDPCGMVGPTDDEITDIHNLVLEYKEGSRGDFRTNVTVPICFHVIMNSTGHGALTDEQLQLQVDALNIAFSSSSCCNDTLVWCETDTCSSETGFRFEMRNDCTTRTVNDNLYILERGSIADNLMKRRRRVGGPDVLNIYYRDLPGRVVGLSWFPFLLKDEPLWKDGIDMDNRAILGDIFAEGEVLAHEVGHWLGLFHTFQSGCFQGDVVMDTNPEASSAAGCPIGRDTCPGGVVGAGLDPIHNYMDYTFGASCQFEFTSDQIDVMHVSHAVYRAERVTREVLVLENGVESEPVTLAGQEMQVYRYELETAGDAVTCIVSYMDELTGTPCTLDCGDTNLYLRWGAEPTTTEYDCASESAFKHGRCTSSSGLDDTTLYVGVYGYLTSLEVTTTCTASIPLANNITSAPVSLAQDSIQIFSLQVFFPFTDVTCRSSGDNGNADLFLGFENVPDIPSGLYNCSSIGDGSDEECALASILQGTVFVSILATSSFTNLTVTCQDVSPVGPIVLENGVSSDVLSLSTGAAQYYSYSLEFPDATRSVNCATVGSNGDADLFLKWNSLPMGDGRDDCGSQQRGSNERCNVDAPVRESVLYILVSAYVGFTDLAMTCTETTVVPPCSRWLQQCSVNEECCSGACRRGRCRLL